MNTITVVERYQPRFEAVKYTGDNKKEVLNFMTGDPYYCDVDKSFFKFIEKDSYIYFNEEHEYDVLKEDDFNKMFMKIDD